MRMWSWGLSICVAGILLAGCGGRSTGPEGVTPPAGAPALLAATPGSKTTVAAPDFQALPGAKAYFGALGRSGYRIEMPSRWNGELLLWAHGVHGFGAEVFVENPPDGLRQALIDEGYAWAASSYSENGYSAGLGANDTLTLKWYFAQRFGAPKRTYIAGASLGGHVVALSLENFPGEYNGGLAVCGAVAGEEQIDYWLAWAMAAEYFAGHQFPIGGSEAQAADVLNASILPALGPVDAPSEAGKAFESVIRNLTGGPRPFFEEGYRTAYPFNFGLLTGDPDRSIPMSAAATNEGADYRADARFGFAADELNRAIRRLAADPELRDAVKHPDTAPTTGRINIPLLTLHETGDLTVPVSAEQSYRRKVEAAGAGGLLVQRLIRSGTHCAFSGEEVVQAWDDLAAWVRDGEKPAGEDVLGDLSDAGRAFTNPLRSGDPGGR